MDFGAAAAKYIDAFFKNIQWDAIAARLEKVAKGLTHWIDAAWAPRHWGRSPQCHASIRILRNAA